MARETFGNEIQRLEADVLSLGHMVQKAIVEVVEALRRQDAAVAHRIIADDAYVNNRRYDIEAECMALIATQQPMARDLRTLAAILAIASELERIHDYAKGIGKIILLIGHQPLIKPIIDLPRMAQKVQGMLHRAILAFARRDVQLARALPQEDDEVDDLYNQIYREIFTYILADPKNLEQGNYLLWAAHNLERTADRVTNICERTIYTVTGQMVELDVKLDELVVG
ncbi:MAG: phosphate signaling complex protein PhoU [Chloroflexi bacterium]|nr:phosphate signaling complex protein PhoU [Chloroflexota bacterium]MDA0243502.1 phosphate signaling complex protein PhoU [Chloroflexota bacterium]